MHVLRLHDPARRPANWTDIIRPGHFAVFASQESSGMPCQADGAHFADLAAATCVVFASVEEARGFCEGAVMQNPALRFDIFDHEGRVRPPLLTIVHPDRSGSLDASPPRIRARRMTAWALVGVGSVLLVYAYAGSAPDTAVTVATVVGINMLVAAGRLLYMNLAARETERDRRRRLEALAGRSRADS